MNSENVNWKCPDCDTINSGRRCIVCGGERPQSTSETRIKSTMAKAEPPKKRINKKLIIIISAVCVAVLAAVVICALIFGGRPKEKEEERPVNSHEIVTDKENIDEPQEEEPDEEYLTDPVFKVDFVLSYDKQKLDKHPAYTERETEYMLCAVPNNFKDMGDGKYFAYDSTAFIEFKVNTDLGGKGVADFMANAKVKLGGNVSYEDSGEDWFALSTERNGIVYYKKFLMDMDYSIEFTFCYPREYKDIYDDYVKNLEKYLKLPENSEIEVIEE